VTARKYVKVLEDHLVPFMDNQPLAFRYVFQHDNAPCHRAKETTLFLKENCIDVLHKCPPYSPDLNVIENLWAYIKIKVRRENIASKENL
jgi:transposase